jgi:hypothetical protein
MKNLENQRREMEQKLEEERRRLQDEEAKRYEREEQVRSLHAAELVEL